MTVICLTITWGMIFSSLWAFAYHWKTGFMLVKQLHQVPCHDCKYFVNSRYLKCTVNPQIACSELAVDCHGYQAQISKIYLT